MHWKTARSAVQKGQPPEFTDRLGREGRMAGKAPRL